MKARILGLVIPQIFVLAMILSGCGGGSDLPNPEQQDQNDCNTDICICDNGAELERQPSLQCDFPECPDDSVCELLEE